jgi:hypothetical protein
MQLLSVFQIKTTRVGDPLTATTEKQAIAVMAC